MTKNSASTERISIIDFAMVIVIVVISMIMNMFSMSKTMITHICGPFHVHVYDYARDHVHYDAHAHDYAHDYTHLQHVPTWPHHT